MCNFDMLSLMNCLVHWQHNIPAFCTMYSYFGVILDDCFVVAISVESLMLHLSKRTVAPEGNFALSYFQNGVNSPETRYCVKFSEILA